MIKNWKYKLSCGQHGYKYNNIRLPLFLMAGVGILVWLKFRQVTVPKYLQVVSDFDIHQYAGKWHEIARFDFKHEKNLSHVTADYSVQANGSVRVENKGYDITKGRWKTATGIASFVGATTEAALKVSFFRPFYSGYNVVLMDPDYENALIFGEDRNYIWFLSRNKTMSSATKQKFMEKAREAGYNLERLIWTKQD